jgi:uncharacterized protein YcbK (DUF882 family)
MVTRRTFLRALGAGLLLYPSRNASAFWKGERELKMYNSHTDEFLNIQYCSSGIYDPTSIDKINYFLRCHYTNKIKKIDLGVLDLLCDIKDRIGKEKTVEIISGYRSPYYNRLLVNQGRNVSRKSLHIQGQAIDFKIRGISNRKLARIAKSFQSGGVGTYPEFVHIDVGRVRSW